MGPSRACAVAPQVWAVLELFGEFLDLDCEVFVADLLIFESAVLGHPAQVLNGFAPRLFCDRFGEASAGNEGVDQFAIEGVGGSCEGVEPYGEPLFAVFELRDALLADAHAAGQFRAGHAESVPDGTDPAHVWAGQFTQRTDTTVPLVQTRCRAWARGLRIAVLLQNRSHESTPQLKTSDTTC